MKNLIISFGVLFLLQGCATITSPNSKRVHFLSSPDGATVVSDKGIECVTPCGLKMHGMDDQYVTIRKEGYADQKRLLTTTFLNRTWLNVLFFWPGVIVDFATGAVWRFEPREVKVEMQKL